MTFHAYFMHVAMIRFVHSIYAYSQKKVNTAVVGRTVTSLFLVHNVHVNFRIEEK